MQDNNLKDTFISKGFFLWTIVGPTGCGKTHELQRILLNKKYGIREHFKPQNIYLFSKNCRKDESSLKLITELQKECDEEDKPLFSNDFNIFCKPSDYLKQIDLICQTQQELQKDKMEPKLLIFDDFIGANVDSRCKQLSNLSTDARHMKLSIIQILHDFRKIDPMQICQQTHLSVYYQKNYERLRTIFRDICGYNHKTALELYKECVQQPYGYLFINFNLSDKDKFHNTIDYQYTVSE